MHDRDRPGVFTFGPFSLHVVERPLKKGDEEIRLGGRALDLLIALVERAGEVVDRNALMSRVWPDVTVEEANLRVHMTTLRRALGDGHSGARYVVNVTGRGYAFVAPVARSTAASPAPDQATVPDRFQKLPALPARVVGRDDVVRAVSAQLMMWRFISIVGPGGIGKTTAAVSVAHALFGGFDGSVFFVDLGALTDPQLVQTAVASTLGFMVQTRDLLPTLLAYIGDKRILRVLDTCEHVIDLAATLAERVVSEAPQAHVLTGLPRW